MEKHLENVRKIIGKKLRPTIRKGEDYPEDCAKRKGGYLGH